MEKKLPEDFSCVVNNCKEKLLGRLSPDMDIQGIGFCKKHKTIVAGAYITLINGNEKLFRSLVGYKDEVTKII